jgi:GT2 family glycosyltransferase
MIILTVPDVSISIVSFNTSGMLQDCLNSLMQSPTEVQFEILVVDNGSHDGSLEILITEFPQVHIICLQHNEGYTRPMNLGLRAGQGRYLLQLNPDTIVHPGLLDGLVQFMDQHPEVGIATPKVLNRDGTLQKQCRRSAARPLDTLTYFSGLNKIFPKSRFFGRYLMTYMGDDDTFEVEAVSGSCMMIRRAVVDQIGYLDESYFAYQEDTDFCFRAREAGWKIFYVPTVSLVHFGGQGGSRVQPYNGIIQWHRSYYLYYRKHLSKEYFFLINGLMYLFMAFKLGFSLAVNYMRKEKIVGTRKP